MIPAVRLVEEVGPITATSANISGSPPEDEPAMVARSLSTDGSHVPFVSGLCGGGVPSTLISWQSSTQLTRYYRNQGAERRFSEKIGGF